MSLDSARATPVHTVLSGPAGGVQGAAFVAARAGLDRHPHLRHGRDLDRRGRLLRRRAGDHARDRGRRLPGAGARRSTSRASARAAVRSPTSRRRPARSGSGRAAPARTPAPPATGGAASKPTVTDANVVLGHLPPRLLGGAMELDAEAAWAAVRALGDSLALDAPAAAAGVVDIVNENMLGALRVVTVQRGLTPSDFALVSFGGAGGLHANALAALLGCFPVIVPPESGVLSALGFVASEIKNEFSQTFIRDAAATTPAEISRSARPCWPAQADDWLGRRAGRRSADRLDRVRGRHALPPPGLRAPDRAGRTSSPACRSRRWSSASTRSTTASTASGSRAAPRSSTSARSRGAACRSPRSRRMRLVPRIHRRSTRHPAGVGRRRGASRCRRSSAPS